MKHIKETIEGDTDLITVGDNKKVRITKFTMKSSDDAKATIGSHIQVLYRVRAYLGEKFMDTWVQGKDVDNKKLRDRLINDLFIHLEKKR